MKHTVKITEPVQAMDFGDNPPPPRYREYEDVMYPAWFRLATSGTWVRLVFIWR